MRSLLISILGIALFLVRYWDAIFQHKIVGNGHDTIHLISPIFKKANTLLLSGQSPLWFEELVGGIPFYNNAMFSFTYPLYFLGIIDYGEGIEILRMLSLITILHLGILFISNFILLRVIGFDKLESLLAGFTIILCLNTVYNTPWIIAIAGYAMMPLFFAGVISLINHKSMAPGLAMLAISSLSFLAKPAQTAILAIVFGMVLTLVGLWHNRDKVLSLIPRFMLAGVLILGINLPGLVQLYLDFPEMIRFSAAAGAVQGNTKIPLEGFRSQVDFSEALDYLIYQTRSIGVGHPWTGPLALFALFAFWFIPQPTQRRSWILVSFFSITVFTIIMAFGKELPTFWLHYYTPLLNKIRESSRFLFVTNIGMSVLIGYFLSSIKQHWNNINTRRLAVIFLGCTLFTLSYQCYLDLKPSWPSIVIFITSSLAIGVTHIKQSYTLFISLVLASLIAYALLLPNLIYGKHKVGGFGSSKNVAMHDTFSKFADLSPDRADYRTMYHVNDIRDGEFSNAGLYYNIRSFQGTTVVIPADQYRDLWHADKFLNYRLFWGAKYHVYPKNHTPTSSSLSHLFSSEQFSVYTHDKALPRAYFAEKALKFNGTNNQFRKRLERQKTPRPYAYFTDDIMARHPYLSNYPKDIKSKVISNNFYNNTLTIKVEQEKKAVLTINEYYSPHWKATIDGDATAVIKVNVNQMAIISPPGSHEINLQYQPTTFQYFKIAQKFSFFVTTIVTMFAISLYFTKPKRLVIQSPL